MTHSASFRATGSDIAASAWVASAGLCLRTSSITFSSASVSVREVDAVAATAAGAGGVVLGTTLRAIGRGFGNGTLGLAEASAAHIPAASIRLVAKAVDRNAAAREGAVTTFPDGESFNR